jgi:hypothetical protein
MGPLTAARLLDIWEEGRAAGPVDRALLLLGGACPGEDVEALAALPVGERDRRLLRIREWAFGTRISSVGRCPECGEAVEMDFALEAVAPWTSADSGDAMLEAEGIQVRFRPPDSRDLAELALHLRALSSPTAASSAPDVGTRPSDPPSEVPSPVPDAEAEARRFLLDRCVVEARRHPDGTSMAPDQLPATVEAAVVEALEAADPMADLAVEVTCPGCSHAWSAALDVPGFLWEEVDRWARRTLLEVHALASAYAWPEAEILRLSPTRRRLYLELVGA